MPRAILHNKGFICFILACGCAEVIFAGLSGCTQKDRSAKVMDRNGFQTRSSKVAELTFVRINDLAAPVDRMNTLMRPGAWPPLAGWLRELGMCLIAYQQMKGIGCLAKKR